MRIKTGFYFIGWMLTRLFRTLVKFPLRFHRRCMYNYQRDFGLTCFVWVFITACISMLAGFVAMVSQDTIAQGQDKLAFTFSAVWVISFSYFIICVILDQYEKFEDERLEAWHTLKD